MVRYRMVNGFPGYRVGDDGTVWTRFEKVWTKGVRGCQTLPTGKWRKMVPGEGERGHLFVVLHRGSLGKSTRLVHRVVLEAFVGPCPPGMEACHYPDRDPSNNSLSNLRWGTKKENMRDRDLHGTTKRGEKVEWSKLTEEAVQAIRREYIPRKVSQRFLAKKYGVSQGAVFFVLSGKNWKHVQ